MKIGEYVMHMIKKHWHNIFISSYLSIILAWIFSIILLINQSNIAHIYIIIHIAFSLFLYLFLSRHPHIAGKIEEPFISKEQQGDKNGIIVVFISMILMFISCFSLLVLLLFKFGNIIFAL